jgi:hypothetical protein
MGVEIIEGPSLPPKPKPPLFSAMGRVEYHAMKRLKVLSLDPETKSEHVDLTTIPDEVTPEMLDAAMQREVGRRLVKIIVLDRFWTEQKKLTGLEKFMITAGVASLFLGGTRRD